MSNWGTSSLANNGPHGLSEMLYAYTSGAGNNGSAFAGLNANTPWWDTTLGIDMLLGRFGMIVPLLALAGSLARKKIVPASAGTFSVSGFTFAALLVGTVVLVGALTFLPALALGPVVEHFLMLKEICFNPNFYDSRNPFPFLTRKFSCRPSATLSKSSTRG